VSSRNPRCFCGSSTCHSTARRLFRTHLELQLDRIADRDFAGPPPTSSLKPDLGFRLAFAQIFDVNLLLLVCYATWVSCSSIGLQAEILRGLWATHAHGDVHCSWSRQCIVGQLLPDLCTFLPRQIVAGGSRGAVREFQPVHFWKRETRLDFRLIFARFFRARRFLVVSTAAFESFSQLGLQVFEICSDACHLSIRVAFPNPLGVMQQPAKRYATYWSCSSIGLRVEILRGPL
jgi:hypothetical protein